jgi:hypothetical protein
MLIPLVVLIAFLLLTLKISLEKNESQSAEITEMEQAQFRGNVLSMH